MAISVFDTHDGLGLAGLVAQGQVSPGELLDEAIERTELVHDRLNVLAFRDFDYARRLIATGLPEGPFKVTGQEYAAVNKAASRSVRAGPVSISTRYGQHHQPAAQAA